jgi:hypothetical protein
VTFDDDGEVVGVQLEAPRRVRTVLGAQRQGKSRTHPSSPPRVLPNASAQDAKRILSFVPGGVVPAFYGRETEVGWLLGDRVAPGLGGEPLELCSEIAASGRRGEERPDDRKPEPRPSVVRGIIHLEVPPFVKGTLSTPTIPREIAISA